MLAFGERRDLGAAEALADQQPQIDRLQPRAVDQPQRIGEPRQPDERQQEESPRLAAPRDMDQKAAVGARAGDRAVHVVRSEEHTSELQSLMRISYAVFCLK